MLQLLLDPQAASPAAFPIDGGGVVESSAGGIAVIDIIGPLVHRNQAAFSAGSTATGPATRTSSNISARPWPMKM